VKGFDSREIGVGQVFREVVGKTDFNVFPRDIASVNEADLNLLIRVRVFAFFNVGAFNKEATIKGFFAQRREKVQSSPRFTPPISMAPIRSTLRYYICSATSLPPATRISATKHVHP
jgi:hypothetical protein